MELLEQQESEQPEPLELTPQCNEAIAAINKYGDFTWFASDDLTRLPPPTMNEWMNIPEEIEGEEIPFN